METVCRKIGEKLLSFLKIPDRAESKAGDFAAAKFRLPFGHLSIHSEGSRRGPIFALRIIAP
jgi:hypothetical protein